jgi:hypothetical protein
MMRRQHEQNKNILRRAAIAGRGMPCLLARSLEKNDQKDDQQDQSADANIHYNLLIPSAHPNPRKHTPVPSVSVAKGLPLDGERGPAVLGEGAEAWLRRPL